MQEKERTRRTRESLRMLALLALGLMPLTTLAQQRVLRINGDDVRKNADGVLALMSYAVVPDLTTSSLSITNAATGNPDLSMTQFAGGFTISQSTPLYLEGGIAASRYDPTFVASDGTESNRIPTKWNCLAGSLGVGWDFPIADELKFRPILNFALGRVSSDAAVAATLFAHRRDREIQFLDGGRLDAIGYGGSLMLDYEHYRPEHEIDVELRLTAVHLDSYGASADVVKGSADSQTLNLWSRYRAPTGLTMFDRPFRYVLEYAHSEFFGDQRGALGFVRLNSFGAGIEFDSSAYPVFITRTRFVLRYMVGDDVSGTSLGIAVSF
ncbi:hypothetical protein [Niveibacterium sp. SC-1]|uniref:hypothetical protein n=1 Tax=Niveibacterium sp. SC-1 TaxID=3135646 RepID=UPI0031203307